MGVPGPSFTPNDAAPHKPTSSERRPLQRSWQPVLADKELEPVVPRTADAADLDPRDADRLELA
jgi:hypothetical protein